VTGPTRAFQAAIDACAKGGGVVRVGPGRYVIGSIQLRSNVELRVEEGAEILGSTSLDDYSEDNQGAIEAPEFDKCLLYAENARSISITVSNLRNVRLQTRAPNQREKIILDDVEGFAVGLEARWARLRPGHGHVPFAGLHHVVAGQGAGVRPAGATGAIACPRPADAHGRGRIRSIS